ncbi:SusC/RagA family TonB-linked outer membrane protein [Elizabethkingia anophelis]|uniref:SusC/RagA family TonB-linked outer membrane protein n=1 Tax=Elizabethkingia anophelis TaxID=1117645 RepID=UPI000D02BA88|nr:SusC/RagA family TonB-linked outer membrane protein [Elizabethkingia anophelis]MCL1689428.1 SusC/RagA family TonB-linked outer membrane protein [Elizabethkingia anophelis]MDV4009440.1 SusC/RagA family protein [Elizabethkingia anophelis]MYY46370.1 SusC/RagA family TonB-linked outer membrane protein [Elizabethkingia anophelis]PRQ84112.1 SusC/RagA family protein [Elizabethkingia anophelis]PRQ85012.1 SusC/RagA family protein [Elizabethkingia anophelis]
MKKNFCRGHLSLVFTISAAMMAYAQTLAVTGNISGQNGSLSGVIVRQEGKSFVTTTNDKGQFSLSVEGDNPVLIFEHPDYLTKKEALRNRTTLLIRLSNGVKHIEEVVLNAGYYKVKDKERTGSIAKVTAKEIENQPVTNVLSAVQGRVSGVNITSNGGLAGGGLDIQIRGKNSLRSDGNYPLIIVDGIPLNTFTNSLSTLSSGILSKGESSPLNAINPDDIESFEILKDADATAIYGSRGANGVILITTKKGKNKKTAVELSLTTSVSKTNNLLKLAGTEGYLQMRKDAYKNDGIINYPVSAYDVNGTWDQKRYTNWYKTFIGRTFLSQQRQLSLSGGNGQTQFLVGLHHQDQSTAFGHDLGYKRYGFNINVTHVSSDKKFRISPTIYYTIQNNNLSEKDLTTQIVLSPNAPALYDSSGKLNWENNTFDNPLSKLENKYTSKINTFSAGVNAEYELLSHLTFKVNSGYTITHQKEIRTNPSSAYNPSLGYGSNYSVIYTGNVVRESWITEPQLSWEKKWNKHSLSALIGTTFEEKKDQILRLQGSDFASNELLYNFSSAKVQKVNEDTEIKYRYMALYSRLNYNYSGKYIINLTARRDGSSRFGPHNRFANFGAIGIAWLFSKEAFFKNSSYLSFGKLRGSYGVAGSDLIGDYQYLNTYSTNSLSYDGVTGLYPSRLYNPDFSWEKTRKLEAALELGFFKDRINFSLSWYRNISSNQLVGIPLPATTGFLSIQNNFPAKVENTGTELDFSATLIKNALSKWNLSANLSTPINKLLAYDNIESSAYANTYVVGKSMNIRKVYELKGVNPVTGVYEFTDFNGDGKIDSNDRGKWVDIGVKYFGGISNRFDYKNLSLSFLIQFVKQRSYSLDYSLGMVGNMKNIPEYMLDYWTPENPNAKYQRPSTGSNTNAVRAFSLYQSSDAVIVDASYIRLNNVQLAYRIPLGGNSTSLTLILQGQNLWTITGYKGLDPEVQGLYLPSLKTYSLTASLKF